MEFISAANRIAAQLIPSRTVALRVTDAPEIQRLNHEFRQIDRPTDVLSFPSGDGAAGGHAGDIALSWAAVERQARANRNPVLSEAVALFAHGLLHITGWDHPTDDDQERFDARTRELCASVGIEVETFGH